MKWVHSSLSDTSVLLLLVVENRRIMESGWAGRNKVILEHNEVNFGLTETRLLDAWVWDLGNWDYTNGFSFYNFSFFVADPPTILVQEPWIHTGETSTVQLKCQICSHNPFTVRHLHLIQFLRYCNISFLGMVDKRWIRFAS